MYSNFTPRSAKLSKIPAHLFDNRVVFFGLQYFVKHFLIDTWNAEFFGKPKAEVVARHKRRMDTSLGAGAIPVEHIEALHERDLPPRAGRHGDAGDDQEAEEDSGREVTFFYTDPLAAAWMKENHGFRILCMGREVSTESITGGDLFPPFEVHPDSLGLLEPKLGDVIEYPQSVRRFAVVHAGWFGKGFCMDCMRFADGKIIQRD